MLSESDWTYRHLSCGGVSDGRGSEQWQAEFGGPGREREVHPCPVREVLSEARVLSMLGHDYDWSPLGMGTAIEEDLYQGTNRLV